MRELVRRRPALGDRCSAAAWKSSKTFCLCAEHAGAVPVLALLAAAAQVGDGVDAAGLDPGEEPSPSSRASSGCRSRRSRRGSSGAAGPAAARRASTNIRTVVPSARGVGDLLASSTAGHVDRRRAAVRPQRTLAGARVVALGPCDGVAWSV